ncbi:MFS transporter [Romeria aff. gracilis LEGE 07310]|uniref:MFS transporter n=2 Tax=Vasconcelosia TaxID=3366328 RepID=A0A8J7AK91_9CYAN|nr:MFS transporter [Romeria aff. gracilis LEGE 07310]
MQFIANSWLILNLTGNGSSVAVLLFVSTIPGIFFSFTFGAFVDQINRKYLAISIDIFRASVLLTVPLVWWFDLLHPWHIYAATFLVSVGDELFYSTTNALVCDIFSREALLTANSVANITYQAGAVLGTGISGLVISLYSPYAVMIINAFTFLISAVCILNVAYTGSQSKKSAEVENFKGSNTNVFTNVREGLYYALKRLDIVSIYLVLLLLFTTVRAINALLSPFVQQELNLGAVEFGLIDAAFSVGAIIGCLLLPIVVSIFKKKAIMIFCIWALSGSLVLFSISRNLFLAILGYFLIGLFLQVRVLYQTIAQRMTDANFQGRMYSLFSTCLAIESLIVYLAIGILGDFVSYQVLYVAQAALIGITGLVAIKLLSARELYHHVLREE